MEGSRVVQCVGREGQETHPTLIPFPLPSLFPSSLSVPSLPFPSLPFPFLPFPSLPLLLPPRPSSLLPSPPLPSPTLPFPSLRFASLPLPPLPLPFRPPGLPNFRKLYAKLDTNIPAGTKLMFNITQRFDVESFAGRKYLVVSTTSWLGGKNPFLGYAYIVVGTVCLLLAFVFGAKHHMNPRKLGDTDYLVWKDTK